MREIKIAKVEFETKSRKQVAESVKKEMADKKDRMKRMYKQIPPIHWEILKFSNTHTKDEVLLKYPEHSEFINRIYFNS